MSQDVIEMFRKSILICLLNVLAFVEAYVKVDKSCFDLRLGAKLDFPRLFLQIWWVAES